VTRPTYETEEHLAVEDEVKKIIEAKWKCEAIKLGRAYSLDYALVRDGKKVEAFAEIKERRIPWSRMEHHGGFLISLNKWRMAKEFCELSGLPLLIVVRADGDLRYAKITEFKMESVVWQGRKDRGDPADMEPHAVIPVASFVKL
jgi:hypothetical protein